MGRSVVRKLVSSGLACVAWIALPLWAAPADDVKRLLDEGKSDEAYRTALRTPAEAGKPAFDFYYGIAAVNAGKPSEGVLALERYLLNFPDSAVARLELARGYYLLADDGRARDEFEAILATKPPANIAKVVREYLTAIGNRESRHKTTYAFSVEVGGGNDSNVQSGVSDPNIVLPIFGAITLTDSSLAKRDRFGSVLLAGRIAVPVRQRWNVFAQVGADLRQYRVADTYDQNTFSAAGGIGLTRGAGLYRLTLGATRQTLDNSRYRDTYAMGSDYGRQWGTNGVFTLGAQGAKFKYAGDNAIRDANYYSLQTGYRHLVPGDWRTEFDANLSVARESITADGRDDLSRNLFGGRAGIGLAPFASVTFGLGATYLKSNYLAADQLLQITRRDDYSAFDFSATYAFNPAWSLRGEYLASRNKSNLPLYEYKREIGQLKLRYDFR